MSKSRTDIDMAAELKLFRSLLNNLVNKQGKILCIAGESGFGKTYLMQAFHNLSQRKEKDVISIYIESQAPIGKFNVGNLQPLLPFSRAVAQLMDGKDGTAKKKFAVNVGMTALACLPIAGEIFYAVKEIGKDWRKFKKEKSSESVNNSNNAAAEFYDTLNSFADKKPLLLLLDDMHWADAQSIELLSMFAEKIHELPILIIISYKQTELERTAAPLLKFISKNENNPTNVEFLNLQAFTQEQIAAAAKFFLPNYKNNPEFEEWLNEHSYGVPGVVAEYLRYFALQSPFDKNGKLVSDFGTDNFLPPTIHSAFSQKLHNLSEDERNTLSLCSAEGRQFTASVMSELLNTDILTTIKKLRGLQHKTGIIKSIGAQQKYGIKSTAYEFTEAFYHEFFANSLEYEEHTAIHGQIATILKQVYDNSESDELREQIAPYIAAHSSEAGDEETTRSMLLVAAKTAKDYGSLDIINEAYHDFSDSYSSDSDMDNDPENIAFKQIINSASANAEFSDAEDIISAPGNGSANVPAAQNYQEFRTIRRAAVNAYHQEKFQMAAESAFNYYTDYNVNLTVAEKAQLLALALKAYIELSKFDAANKIADECRIVLEGNSDLTAECFIYNALASLKAAENNESEALDLLYDAAQNALKLPLEMRLLTLSNIALIMDKVDPDKSGRFFNAIRSLSSKLNFDNFADDIFKYKN